MKIFGGPRLIVISSWLILATGLIVASPKAKPRGAVVAVPVVTDIKSEVSAVPIPRTPTATLPEPRGHPEGIPTTEKNQPMRCKKLDMCFSVFGATWEEKSAAGFKACIERFCKKLSDESSKKRPDAKRGQGHGCLNTVVCKDKGEKAWVMLTRAHAEAHAKAQGSTGKTDEEDTGMSPIGQESVNLLLSDFEVDEAEADLSVKKQSLAKFMPKCLAHTQNLVNSIDHAYTDAQLKSVLTHDCIRAKEFPHAHKQNFKSHKACLKFAQKLSAARDVELKTGKKDQYKNFCADYYKHATGKKGSSKKEGKKEDKKEVKKEAEKEAKKEVKKEADKKKDAKKK